MIYFRMIHTNEPSDFMKTLWEGIITILRILSRIKPFRNTVFFISSLKNENMLVLKNFRKDLCYNLREP